MSALETARAAWGDPLPDWIEALAQECERTSQNKTARRLGYTAGAVSQLLHGAYRANTAALEATVRGALMAETVACPVLGELGIDHCLRWRRRGFRNGNSLDVTMFRACARCPQNRKEGSE